MKKDALLKYIKLLLGSVAAIGIGQMLSLRYAYAAGIITLLTIQDTKKETIQITLKRIIIFIVMTVISIVVFKVMGYTFVAYSVVMVPYLLVCILLKMKEAIAPIAVLCTHYVSEKDCSLDMIWNELLILIIGAGIGIILNMFIRDNKIVMRKKLQAIENKMREIFSSMAFGIEQHQMMYKTDEFFDEIDSMLKDLKKEAITYAILDAELLATAPASVAAACGMDAFIHAEEAYVSKAASPFSDAMAEKAMELIGGHIRRYTADRGDLEAAEAMLVGSLFAGIAFSFARLGNVHAMSHPVSAYFHVSHGVANAVLLPVVMEYNALADQGRYRKIYNWIARESLSSHGFLPEMLADAVRKLNRELGIPEDLVSAARQAAGDGSVSEADLRAAVPAMAADAMKSGNIAVNPRASVQRDIEQLYLEAMKAVV